MSSSSPSLPIGREHAQSSRDAYAPSSTLGSAQEPGTTLVHRAHATNGHAGLAEIEQKLEEDIESIVDRVEQGLHTGVHNFEEKLESEFGHEAHLRRQKIWDRFRGKGRRFIGWRESARNVVTSSVLNVLLILIPFAWASHWSHKFHGGQNLTFALCFLGIIPLEKLFDYGGEQMAFYTGRDLGDLIIVTLNNAVEATLAIILLVKCELRLLQATVIGVVLLHLLLVPGTAFLTGGARIWEQNLHPHLTELNHTLLTIGVLSLLIPAAFFAALDNGVSQTTLVSNATNGVSQAALVSDASRHHFLQMSRGIAILLLSVYIASRIFLHDPPGDGNAFQPTPNAPKEIHEEEKKLLEEEPEVNVWFCMSFLIVTIAIMAVTAEMLVESIEHVREEGGIQEEWFGLILLPIVSFSADGVVAIVYFLRAALFLAPAPPATLAKARAIDLSIQFTIFWMPFMVLLAWWTNKPLTMLFDLYEVALVLGACFLVNYVTADAKTNWAEGWIMVTFYFMIALCSWFYPGQESIEQMLDCVSVAHALADASEGLPAGDGGAVEAIARKLLLRV